MNKSYLITHIVQRMLFSSFSLMEIFQPLLGVLITSYLIMFHFLENVVTMTGIRTHNFPVEVNYSKIAPRSPLALHTLLNHIYITNMHSSDQSEQILPNNTYCSKNSFLKFLSLENFSSTAWGINSILPNNFPLY